MSEDTKNLWAEVENKCLLRASELLDDKTAPAAATAEAVYALIETAISVDGFNFRRTQGQPGAPVPLRQTSVLPTRRQWIENEDGTVTFK